MAFQPVKLPHKYAHVSGEGRLNQIVKLLACTKKNILSFLVGGPRTYLGPSTGTDPHEMNALLLLKPKNLQKYDRFQW